MHVAPMADPSDGFFDIVTMEMSRARTLGLTAHIYRGTHLEQEGVRHYRARTIEARLTRLGESLIDADGEQVGALPLKVEMMPRAVELIT